MQQRTTSKDCLEHCLQSSKDSDNFGSKGLKFFESLAAFR